MKFKATIVGCLITALLIGATTAVLLVQEAKQQTQISLEILAEQKRQTESIENAEQEIKDQTEIAIKTADLISLQIDIAADKIIMESVSKDVGYSELTNSAYNAAFRRAEMEKIRETLGLDILHNVSGVGNYSPDEEVINIVRPNK